MSARIPHFFRFRTLSSEAHAITTRHGGVSEGRYRALNLGFSTLDSRDNVRDNRLRVAGALGVAPENVIPAHLTHGAAVSVFRRDEPERWPVGSHPGPAVRSDAVVTNAPGVSFLLTFADCVPIALEDPRTGALAAIHAGWRGTAAGIAGNAVQAMEAAFGTRPGDLRAGIGPSIGPCCYTVEETVPAAFRASGMKPVLRRSGGRTILDLWASNTRQLLDVGVNCAAIEVAEICTGCTTHDYFSHRAERGVTGRFGMVVGIRQTP